MDGRLQPAAAERGRRHRAEQLLAIFPVADVTPVDRHAQLADRERERGLPR
jgi:hypothetical protein